MTNIVNHDYNGFAISQRQNTKNWIDARTEYEAGKITSQQIANKLFVSLRTVQKRSKKESWIKFVELAIPSFDQSIVLWADAHLVYCEDSILYVGVAGDKPDTLSTSYAAFCYKHNFIPLKIQNFSPELMKYLKLGKQWQINKHRDAIGTHLLNIAFT